MIAIVNGTQLMMKVVLLLCQRGPVCRFEHLVGPLCVCILSSVIPLSSRKKRESENSRPDRLPCKLNPAWTGRDRLRVE